jgi:alpha-amylase
MWASQPSIPFLPPAYHLLLLVLFPLASCLTLSELRHRSIYQVLTDRFARPDDHLAPCDLARKSYCGGTWKGIERKLGYIQGMGFDTGTCFPGWWCPRHYAQSAESVVWISPVVLNVELEEDTAYHGECASASS